MQTPSVGFDNFDSLTKKAPPPRMVDERLLEKALDGQQRALDLLSRSLGREEVRLDRGRSPRQVIDDAILHLSSIDVNQILLAANCTECGAAARLIVALRETLLRHV